MKIASSLDGKIADSKGNSKYITSIETRRFVHRLRFLSDAVLIGAGTVKKDNPRLNYRLLRKSNGKRLSRIVLDGNLSLTTGYRIFNDDGQERIILTTRRAFVKERERRLIFEKRGVKVVPLGSKDHKISAGEILEYLGSMNILYLLVEGGSEVFTNFIKEDAVDNLILCMAPVLFGPEGRQFFLKDQIMSVCDTPYRPSEVRLSGNDVISIYHREGSDVYRFDRIFRTGS